MRVSNRAAVAVAAAVLVTGVGCTQDHSASAANAGVTVASPADPNVFAPEHPEQFSLVRAEVRRVHDSMDVNGVVAADVARTVPVNSLSGGRVIEIHARLGDDVRKGQLLLKISSNDLAAAFADYEKAVSGEVLTRRVLARTKDLYDHGAAPQKDVDAADDAERKALVDVRTTSEKVRILGGSLDHPTSIIEIRSPISGTIIEQQVQASAGVKSLDSSPNLFTVADLSEVWVLCDLYESNLAQVRRGDFADVRFNAYPQRVIRARVSNISSLLDPNTRTAKVRLQVPNPGKILRPGMFATATFTSQVVRERIAIPATAVLRLHDRDWVFRPLGPKEFRRAPIESAGSSSDGYQFIAAGLRAGDPVINNALQFASAIDK